MPPAVTVVVPTHDRPALLRRALDAILAQRGVDLQVVVCDDGSTNPALTSCTDPRVRVIRHPAPRGVVAARNSGIAAATAPWVAFCDDDDLWSPDKLASQTAALRESGRRWCFAGSVDVDENGLVVGGAPPSPPDQVPALLRRYNAVPGGGSGVVVERDLLTTVGGFANDFQDTHLEDWELWLRLAEHGPPASAPHPLLAYQLHTTNASLHTAELLAGAELLVQHHGIPLDWGAFHRFLAWTARRGHDGSLYRHHLRQAVRHGAPSLVLREVAGTFRGSRRCRRGEGPPARLTAWQQDGQRWVSQLWS